MVARDERSRPGLRGNWEQFRTIVCEECGRLAYPQSEPEEVEWWIVAPVTRYDTGNLSRYVLVPKDHRGEWVVRCPQHWTSSAVRVTEIGRKAAIRWGRLAKTADDKRHGPGGRSTVGWPYVFSDFELEALEREYNAVKAERGGDPHEFDGLVVEPEWWRPDPTRRGRGSPSVT